MSSSLFQMTLTGLPVAFWENWGKFFPGKKRCSHGKPASSRGNTLVPWENRIGPLAHLLVLSIIMGSLGDKTSVQVKYCSTATTCSHRIASPGNRTQTRFASFTHPLTKAGFALTWATEKRRVEETFSSLLPFVWKDIRR